MNRRTGKRKRGMANQEPHSPKHTSNPTEQEESGAYRPSSQATAFSREVHAPKADTKRSEPHQKDKHWLEYATGGFAFIAATGAIAAAVFAGWQAWIAQDAEVRQLRAYVHITPGTISVTGNTTIGPFDVTVRPGVKIFGQTPAGSVVVLWNPAVAKWPMGEDFAFDYLKTKFQSTSSQAPGEERPIDAKTKTITADDMRAINAGTSKFYAYGTIFYSDIFRKPHYTNFCWFFDLDTLAKREASDCPIHNGADWNNSAQSLYEKMNVPMK
jgi:hypothetical protein